jgi:hypothetical protein
MGNKMRRFRKKFKKHFPIFKPLIRKCPRCGRSRPMTRHSPQGHHIPPYEIMCRECHDKIHGIERHDKKWKISRGRKVR